MTKVLGLVFGVLIAAMLLIHFSTLREQAITQRMQAEAMLEMTRMLRSQQGMIGMMSFVIGGFGGLAALIVIMVLAHSRDTRVIDGTDNKRVVHNITYVNNYYVLRTDEIGKNRVLRRVSEVKRISGPK